MVPDTDSFAGVMQCGGGHFSLVYYEYTVNGDVSILYLFSLEDPNAQPEILFTNEEQVMEAQGDTSQVPRPYVVHMGEDWIFYSVEVGPHGNVTTSLYGYQIATGETKLLVEDDFFVGGDLSPVGDTLYWYEMCIRDSLQTIPEVLGYVEYTMLLSLSLIHIFGASFCYNRSTN